MNSKKLIALLLCLVMIVGMLAACGTKPADDTKPADTEPEQQEETTPAEPEQPEETTPEEPEKEPADTLVVGYSPFNAKFSPFFSETAYDQDAMSMTQIGLLTLDRLGMVVEKGIEGETREYNGTDYTYYGPADLTVTENEDGTVDYDFVLRDDLVFSDGEPLTVDDVIFSMYVLCDPTYDGSSTLYAQPIEGMAEYRSGMDTLFNLLAAAGPDNTDFTYWTEEQQTAFWDGLEAAAEPLAQDIVDYVINNGYAEEGAPVETCAAVWGFELAEGATIQDFAEALKAAYDNDYIKMINTEQATLGIGDLMANYADFTVGVETGESAANISGIQKTGENSLRVHMTKVDATAIYQLGVTIAPMHYYGDASLYDYDNNSFGFPKGDLSSVRAKTTTPMGAGPYKFIRYENNVINYEANETYYQGAPKIPYVNFVSLTTDKDKLNGVVTGTIDVTDPSYSNDTVENIAQTNSNHEQVGDKITTNTVDNLGYGYIGQNAINVSVGGDGSSDASKNLRKAFGTIFSVYRDVAIDSYYGDRAAVINYPISNTSWAAPHASDDGYKVAFSVDVNGNDIYTSAMTAEEKYAAAKEAALGYFEAAGYTVADGKVTAAPEGAKMEYTFWIPGDGVGDHPAFMIVNEAKNALAELGINLIIKDLTNSSELWDNLDAGQVEMWAAAWGATVDPDMYQIYYSDVANGPSTPAPQVNPLGGPAQGGSNYEYCIADPTLDQYIMDARASTNQAYRKAVYKACLDIVVDWATEIPTYQRQNAIIFSTERVNIDTVTPDITTFYGWMSEIQNMQMN